MDSRKFADPDMTNALADGGAEARVHAEIARLDLEQNVYELDMLGYTILRPEQIGPPEFAERLRTKVLDHAEAKSGVRPNWRDEDTVSTANSVLGQSDLYMDIFFSDPVFEQALMAPPVLALLTYLLGETCILNAFNAVIKGRGDEHVPVHNDAPGPCPLPPYSLVANATWLLTDYEQDSGVTCFVPGSHKQCRNPVGAEKTDFSRMQPLVAPAGSVAIWHGNTWHAAYPRTAPGLRIGLLSIFSRHYLSGAPAEYAISHRVTEEMCARNDARFAHLTGVRQLDRFTQMMTGTSQYA